MTQTFAGLRNSIRGLAIGRKGAIQKLVTGRGGRDVGFVLERYTIEDDEIAGHFKITIRGTARDVLCAQRFVFRHIRESHQKELRQTAGCVADVDFPWKYDDEVKGFVIQYPPAEQCVGVAVGRVSGGCEVPPPTSFAQRGIAVYESDGEAYAPTSPSYTPRPQSPKTPPPPASWDARCDWAAPVDPQDPIAPRSNLGEGATIVNLERCFLPGENSGANLRRVVRAQPVPTSEQIDAALTAVRAMTEPKATAIPARCDSVSESESESDSDSDTDTDN